MAVKLKSEAANNAQQGARSQTKCWLWVKAAFGSTIKGKQIQMPNLDPSGGVIIIKKMCTGCGKQRIWHPLTSCLLLWIPKQWNEFLWVNVVFTFLFHTKKMYRYLSLTQKGVNFSLQYPEVSFIFSLIFVLFHLHHMFTFYCWKMFLFQVCCH